VREYLSGARETPQTRERSQTPVEFDEASRLMREALELPVRVKSLRRGGKVEIRFREKEELDALMTLLVPKEPA
jgi:ParB family transcriptional regulator, chromosome partitioning protein